ncbi:CAMK protein kinase [Helicocarpus griseus UAMH5409]|uniref:non-specific serine/threonine protein kinase n=1 Tax=Helicocarpus griseus UAMH5409 TaxID=1447875 RepID=A0A2B7WJX3_9EURO|nr:CAMK protein kinase [Helicocarpus griseus UAMH5409]
MSVRDTRPKLKTSSRASHYYYHCWNNLGSAFTSTISLFCFCYSSAFRISLAMVHLFSDTLEKNVCVGTGSSCVVYHASPTIVVKAVRRSNMEEKHPFLREIEFIKALHERQDRCTDIIECFLALPDHIFLSYCEFNQLGRRLNERQICETLSDGSPGRVISVVKFDDLSLVARWIQQVSSALEYIENMGFAHNNVHPRNCLLDRSLNLKLADFDYTTTIGQWLTSSYAPWARMLPAGPLKGSYGLCGARTEQFAVGTLLYNLVYGHQPYDDLDLKNQDPEELERRFQEMEFFELGRHEIFDGLISACWYNVNPTMALLAYDFKRKTKALASPLETEYLPIDTVKEKETCEALIQKGLLGPDLARQFQRPVWHTSA